MATRTIQPPVGGLNAEDPIVGMKEHYALTLDNWFPDNDRVIVRPGYVEHATGLGSRVETLIPYVGVDGSSKLFGAAGDSIFDVTAAGAVGAAEISGLGNARWEFAGISTSGGNFILAANGADDPLIYDGSTWTAATLTLPGSPGYTLADISWVHTHQRRLWFGVKDSTDLYYLNVDSISGTLILFNPGGAVQRGGSVIAMETWTRDGGDGADDVAVFATSEGEFLVYQGSDPGSISTWGLIGVFRIGRPIGKRFMAKVGGDVYFLTVDGVFPMAALQVDRSQQGYVSITKRVNKLITSQARTYGGTFGWQLTMLPEQRMAVINAPIGPSTARQYVFNAETGAACTFSGLNALCWGSRDDRSFYGAANGSVYEFGVGTTDNGMAITANATQAFIQMRQRVALRRIDAIFFSLDDPQAAVQVSTDYDIRPISALAGQIPSAIARWDEAEWDVATWPAGESIWRGWQSINGYGRAVAVQVRTQTTVGQPAWTATQLMYLPAASVL